MQEEILKSAGFPTDVLLIDFETYFDKEYSFNTLSTIEYVKDKRFECLGFGVWESSHDIQNWYGKPSVKGQLEYYRRIYGKNFENVTLVVQNAFFDPLVLTHHFNISPEYIIDIKHLDRHIEARASHSLKDMAIRWKLSDVKGDTKQFEGLHWRDIKGEPKYELPLIDYCLNDVTLEKELLFKLLPQISRPEIELPLMNHTHKMYLQPTLKLNMAKARALIPKMRVKMSQSTGNYDKKEISGTISFTKMMIKAMPDGEKIPVKEGKPTKNMIPLTGPKLIPAFSKSDPDIDKLRFHKYDEVRNLINAKLALKSWPTHIKKLQNLIRQSKAWDGWLGVPIHYYGGHTGRFSGAEGINVQNFAERVDPLMGEIKKCIEAPDNHTLIIGDLSQIECRDLAYMSGQTDLLECFEDKGDPYSEFATQIFKEDVRKPTKDDPKDLYDLLFLRRYIGKQAVLGLGYGMGDERFFNQIQEYDVVRTLVKNGTLDQNFAEGVVKLYRDLHPYIIHYWEEVEKNFKWVVRYPHDTRTMDCGLKFWSEGKTVRIQLPSGRIQNYPRSILRNNTLQWQYGKLYGGLLVENITQACSRDIFIEGLLNCVEEDLCPVMHVHDSMILCVKENEAEDKMNRMHEILTTPPSWCEGLPLDTDRKISKNYE